MGMLRYLGAIVVGVIAGGVTVFVGESIGHSIYPPPPDLDPATPAGMAAILARAPAGARAAVIAAYAAGATVGGGVAAKLAPTNPMTMAIVVGVLLTFAGISNLLAFPHPHAMAVATLIVFVPFAWLGGRLAGRRG